MEGYELCLFLQSLGDVLNKVSHSLDSKTPTSPQDILTATNRRKSPPLIINLLLHHPRQCHIILFRRKSPRKRVIEAAIHATVRIGWGHDGVELYRRWEFGETVVVDGDGDGGGQLVGEGGRVEGGDVLLFHAEEVD
jgi:hypothetical protein